MTGEAIKCKLSLKPARLAAACSTRVHHRFGSCCFSPARTSVKEPTGVTRVAIFLCLLRFIYIEHKILYCIDSAGDVVDIAVAHYTVLFALSPRKAGNACPVMPLCMCRVPVSLAHTTSISRKVNS